MNSKARQLCPRTKPLFGKFDQGGRTNHVIEEVITLDQEALELCPPGHPDQSLELIQDLDTAIMLSREVLRLLPAGHPHRFASLNNLVLYLSTRCDHVREMKDLDEAITLGREALELCPLGQLNQSQTLNNLAVDLSTRYDCLGETKDLDEAIIFGREALKHQPPGYPHRFQSLNNLAVDLSARYKQRDAMTDLHEIITLGREALGLCPHGHPYRSTSLSRLADDLFSRYEQLGNITDLNQAVALDREALQLCPLAYPASDRSTYLNNLAVDLSSRYKLLWEMTDLHEAIILDREALELRPLPHPDRLQSLNNLAVDLSTRYKLLGVMTDLRDALDLDSEALKLCPLENPDRFIYLDSLAVDLSVRYKQFGEMTDLDDAITLNRQVLELLQPEHPHRSISFGNLAVDLSMRYKRFLNMTDLDEAIALGREALKFCPLGNPDRSTYLNNLAVDLSTRYKQLGAIKDINEAIELGRESLKLCPPGHPCRSNSLDSLASSLRSQLTQESETEDQERVFSLYAQLAHVPQAVSLADLCAAKAWVDAAEALQHKTILQSYETYLRLLIPHLATLPPSPQYFHELHKQELSIAVDAFSACLRNRVPTSAVELLEQGRAIFWNQLTRFYPPLDDIVSSGSEGTALAEEFTRLATLIRNDFDPPDPIQRDRVRYLNVQLQKAISDVRKLPGLSRFLLPPLFSDLQQAAREGPVIIVNASKYGCDALVVLIDQDPVHIPLPITKQDVQELASSLYSSIAHPYRESRDTTKVIALILRKLWDEVVSPILNFLQTVHPHGSRIWWCPTGSFSHLPLHAAGPFRKGQRSFSSFYISSYTPTLTALIHARRHGPSDFMTEEKHFVAIGLVKVAGHIVPRYFDSELASVAQCVDGLAIFTRIVGQECYISRVSEELSKNQWVHFAYNTVSHGGDPFWSGFVLSDGNFTIEHIIRCDTKNPQFAYLSACSTASWYGQNLDEVIHLASAMQFAGFRSIVGTIGWLEDNHHTKEIASMFYKYMVDESGRLDHTRAAFALHRTMETLVDVPLHQRIMYVHMGA